ncbi:AAA family ATPase [Crocosphaera sp.]|uniref:GumC family protein n=1 Tax=Crocosphaera sp. TaxID=2729996 RepID=UPI0026257D2F|nr:AAA family ATPase [Crocosphaera sp.]MDJ0581466.1 AAA family ATPase [Crocosphaera sp.]
MAPPIVKRFAISFQQNYWLGFLTMVAGCGVSGLIALQPPPPPPAPTYSASGGLTFTEPPPAFTTTGNELQAQGRGISLNKGTLLSGRVFQRALARLEKNGVRLSEREIIRMRDRTLDINIPEGGQSGNIALQYTDRESPTRATLILEVFMEEMVENSRWLNTSELRSRIDALSKRLAQVKDELTEAENRFYRYVSQQGSDLLAIQDGSLFSGITSSQQRQRELALALQSVDGQINNLTNQLGLTPEQAYASVALSADPILGQLRGQILGIERQLERLQLDLRPEHPNIERLLKEKQVNENLFKQRAEELIGARNLAEIPLDQIRQDSSLDPSRQQLASQLLTLETRRAGLINQLNSVIATEQQLREQYEKFPDKQLQQAKLVQEVEFQRIVYQNILTALVDAQAAEAETVGSLSVAVPANYRPSPPPQPQEKNEVLIIAAGAGVGLVAGLGIILLLALIDDRLHTPQEIRDALVDREVPVLGQLPFIYSSLYREDLSPVLLDADAGDLSFYERFRSNLRRLGSDISKVVMITSVSNEEGKSATAYNLAIASAQAGKRTLLVETDLRSPSKAQWLEVNPDPNNNLEPLRFYDNRTDAVVLVPAVANLYLLPSPGPQRQAAAIMESSELQLVLKDARGRYDMVIIDSPSLSRCNDALLLESLTDGLVLVTRPGVTRSSLLNEAIDQLSDAEVPVLGAVVNGIEDLVAPTVDVPETNDNGNGNGNGNGSADITDIPILNENPI